MPGESEKQPASSGEAGGAGVKDRKRKVSLARVAAILRPYRRQLIVSAILLALTDGLSRTYSLVNRCWGGAFARERGAYRRGWVKRVSCWKRRCPRSAWSRPSRGRTTSMNASARA